jgi:hypothetical protein
MNIIKTCEHCKEEFTIPFKQRNKKYCNRKCYIEAGITGKPKQTELYETRECLNCGKTFEVRKKLENKLCSDECRKKWNKINAKERCQKSNESSINNNNGVHYLCTDEFKEKSKKTKITKYGTTNHMEVPEIREKFFNSIHNISDEKKQDIVEKRNETKLTKYGDKNYNNRIKFLSTVNEKYNGFHLKNSDILNKSKETHFKNYGVYFWMQDNENKNKIKEAQKNKYNGKFYVQTDEYKEKIYKQRYESAKRRVEKRNFTLLDYINDDYAVIKCNKCGHEFTYTQAFREYDVKCRKCEPLSSDNSLNKFLENIIDNNIEKYKKNDRKILNGKEIDYLLEEQHIGFELNGNYYHSENHGDKNRTYHINKTKLSQNKEIKLIHIFEDEIVLKPHIVESRIKNILGIIDEKIYARKCIIKEVPKKESDLFLNNNHLQSSSIDKIRIGLYYENNLVSIMTFGKKRKALGTQNIIDEYELLRFCNKIDINVIGGFSKLLVYFKTVYKPHKIITYADIRWSGINPNNTVYNKNGFNFIHNTPPNYWYVKTNDFIHRRHRFGFRKDVLLKEGFSIEKTEWEIMQEKGYDRIWDCGCMKFEMTV